MRERFQAVHPPSETRAVRNLTLTAGAAVSGPAIHRCRSLHVAPDGGMMQLYSASGRHRIWMALALVSAFACAPVLPDRSKPGGAARWAQALATEAAVRWARDAVLCRVAGNGVGNEGWLPDRGGSWVLTYASAASGKAVDIGVDTDGRVTTKSLPDSLATRWRPLPAEWDDSPRAWAATRAHQQGIPVNAFEAELAYDAEPQRYAGQLVWRIRFFLQGGGYESHVVSAQSQWLTSY